MQYNLFFWWNNPAPILKSLNNIGRAVFISELNTVIIQNYNRQENTENTTIHIINLSYE